VLVAISNAGASGTAGLQEAQAGGGKQANDGFHNAF
jgi:hypothetical protein